MDWQTTRVVAFSVMIVFGMGLVPTAVGVDDVFVEEAQASHECEFPEIKTNCCWHEMPRPLNFCFN